uniref:Non-specific serine/threonine protein kinase n=1 Tax=Parastrongyloides trichosuri TaxID=131310 RepID=A0A0N4Z6Q3_PARTI
MGSKSKSSSSRTRRHKNSVNRIVAQEISLISDGKRDTLQTTINKTGYLADISSAAGKSGSLNEGLKISESIETINCENSLLTKGQETMSVTDWNSTLLINKKNNNIERKYQSYCIDDTTNGTLLFHNTDPLHGNDNKKEHFFYKFTKPTVKMSSNIDSSSDEEDNKKQKKNRLSNRSKSRSNKNEVIKEEKEYDFSIFGGDKTDTSSAVNFLVTTSTNGLQDQTYNTQSMEQTTSGIYTEFRNEHETLREGSKILAELSLSGNQKSSQGHPQIKKPIKVKKNDKVQPSPIPKENCTDISEINSDSFKKPYPIQQRNTSSKLNRLTLAQQLEETFKEVTKKELLAGDKLNHTYRNSLEETLGKLDIKCLANSTYREESLEKTLYGQKKEGTKLQTPYLSRAYVKNLGFDSIDSETDKNETILLMKGHFGMERDNSPEMVRACSDIKTSNGMSSGPSTINDIRNDKNISSDGQLLCTSTNDVCTIDTDDSGIDNLQLNSTTKTAVLDEVVKPIIINENTKKEQPKQFIDNNIIEDFREEMIQSVNDVCDFLSQKVKNDLAVTLVEERFMENARFLYKFFFHSCREEK